MNPEPRQRSDYSARHVEAARRVLVDLGQILAAFKDCIVVVGGWAPDLLLENESEAHVGSIDIDLALDTEKLRDGRYADLLNLLLDTKRYRMGLKSFQLVVNVDLNDGEQAVQVEVDFLASSDVKLQRNDPKLVEDFRILQSRSCGVAFRAPVDIDRPGLNVRGALNNVHLRVVSMSDFVVMKSHAIGGRDKPKDTYDLCYCLERYPGGISSLSAEWKSRLPEQDVVEAIKILREKFATVNAFGPQQLVEFHSDANPDVRAMTARRAYEQVSAFLKML